MLARVCSRRRGRKQKNPDLSKGRGGVASSLDPWNLRQLTRPRLSGRESRSSRFRPDRPCTQWQIGCLAWPWRKFIAPSPMGVKSVRSPCLVPGQEGPGAAGGVRAGLLHRGTEPNFVPLAPPRKVHRPRPSYRDHQDTPSLQVPPHMTLWVRRLLIANVAVFFLTLALPGEIVNQLVLVPALLPIRPWSVLTYQFLHAGFWHLLMNMVGLFFFGPRLEARIGSRHFLLLYLVSGVGGAVFSILTPRAFIVGASGAVFGVLLGFARYWPRERIYVYAVIPVEARVLVVFLAALSLWSGIGGGGNIAHFAHLGGFVGGWIYLNVMERRSPARRFKREVEEAGIGKPSGRDLERWEGVDRDGLHPINRDEYDRVLGKAREEGVPSVTAQERAFMERFVKP